MPPVAGMPSSRSFASSAASRSRASRGVPAVAAVLRHDDREAVGDAAARWRSSSNKLAAGRLVGDDERVLRLVAVRVEVDDDVLDGEAGRVLNALDQIAPQPA